MLLLSAILIAAVSNLDNLAVGLAYGARRRTVGAAANLIIALVTMAATAVALTSGRAISHLIPASVASWLGSLIIIAIGVATVLASRPTIATAGRDSPRPAGSLRSPGAVSHREALALGFALSLNNLLSGVGAGIAGVPPLVTTLLAGAFSLLCVGGGALVGRWLGRVVFGLRAPLVAGLLLMAIGSSTLPGIR